MQIFYGGAETPTMRRRAASAGAMRFGVSYWNLRDRLPQDGTFPFAERFPEGSSILLDSGGFSANKRVDEFDEDFWRSYLDDYLTLVGQNIDDLALVTEFDFIGFSVDDLWALRQDVWQKLPEEKFLPVWHAEHGFDELINLVETYPQVALTAEGTKEVGHRLPALANKTGARFHGMSISSPDMIAQAGFESISTTGWVSTQRHGDRVVWEQGAMHRYGNKDVDRAVDNHRATIERLGLDPEDIRSGDPEEVAKLTIWSYEAWAKHLARGGMFSTGSNGVTTPTPEPGARNAEVPTGEVATPAPEPGNSVEVAREGRKTLPVVGFMQKQTENEHGEPVTGPPEMRIPGGSARQCNTCYIKHLCPEFKPDASCAFDIPVEIKTKDQLSSMLTGMIEMQTQRALFARYAEELEGGYPTEKVSAEFDRLMKMTHTVKEIQDNRDFMEIHVKARGQSGVISRLFGEQSGQQARQLDRPISPQATDEMLAEVIDAEVE